jgi:hypothetical protein
LSRFDEIMGPQPDALALRGAAVEREALMIPSFDVFPNPGDEWIAAGITIAVLALAAWLARRGRG